MQGKIYGFNPVTPFKGIILVLSRSVLRLRSLILFNVQYLSLQIYAMCSTKQLRFREKSLIDLVARSGVLVKQKNLDYDRLVKEWSNAFQLFNNGDYEVATTKRIGVLSQIYDFHKVERDDYYPPILSNQFFGPFGHHAVIGLHIAAQQTGILPAGERLALLPPKLAHDEIFNVYKRNLRFVRNDNIFQWTEFPINFHLAENLQIWHGSEGFIEGYQVTDKIFQIRNVNLSQPFFTCSEGYIDSSRNLLRSLGLTDQDWFVGLHIRDGGKKPALRNQQVSNYLPAIKEITEKGGWVIRIGGAEMPPLPNLPRVIDLTTQPNALREVHLFVLAKCKFFIGTCSGPQYFPSLFGVPTLFTNQIGPGRSILTFSQHSIHLPKHCVMGDGREVGLYEMFNSPFGFGELTLKEFADRDIHIQENTSEEIRQAVVEIFSRINGTYLDDDTNLDKRVAEIRSEFWWTSKGRIASTYLRENESWFLN